MVHSSRINFEKIAFIAKSDIQHVQDVRLDCDGDALLVLVDQKGAACHTGRRSCFYNAIQGDQVVVTANPAEVGA